jgi:rhodanese-related sulfurtransferase
MENQLTKTTISTDELRQSLNQSADDVFIIDLMGKEEYKYSHIPGAVNIPVEELEKRLSEIPANKTIVVACKRGLMKSDFALQQLQKSGFTNAVKVEGGTNAWLGLNSPGAQC